MAMFNQREIGQEELKYVYESAKGRMDCHPEIAEIFRKRIEGLPVYKDRNEAIKKAIDLNNSRHHGSQVWAKIGKDEDYYYIQDYYIVTDDNKIKQAAEYIGMDDIFCAE